ncbi:MAG: PIN domain-containing protein [bacterium]
MYLADTNVWLELLLDQEHSAAVRDLFEKLDPRIVSITELSFYSIGIIMDRLNQHDAFLDFAHDTIEESGVNLIRVDVEDIELLVSYIKQFSLDFDDAYQYTAATKYGLTIISFDKDFDSTERGRKRPEEILC